ncbi:hypothetical protein [Nocardioides sp.]|uniref:hypothetical protein n=1 Tax=Nocardioides sp. TaxID=35761 RepID=UPI003D0C7556
MRRISWLPVVAIVAGLCVGCANPSRESEADELRTEVAGLPGVTAAQLDYGEPVPLQSGSVVMKVEMSGQATADQVVTVVETAYRAFSSTHQDEEADLSVRAGPTTVALRSFEPEASPAAVSDAVRTGLLAAPASGSVAIDLTTDDVPKGNHVAGTYLVALPDGSTFADIPELLDSLAAQQPDGGQIGWGGTAADGTLLSFDHGFPPAQLVGRWESMQRPDAPVAMRALEDGALFVEARPTARYDVTDPADRRALDRITHPQVRALGDGEWVYTLIGPRGGYLAEIDRFICAPASEGPYDDQLEAWVTARLGPCQAS